MAFDLVFFSGALHWQPNSSLEFQLGNQEIEFSSSVAVHQSVSVKPGGSGICKGMVINYRAGRATISAKEKSKKT